MSLVFIRALRTINVREEEEKLNVWVAYFNLENEYGSPREVSWKTLYYYVSSVVRTDDTDLLPACTRMLSRRYSKERCSIVIPKRCTWLFLECMRGLNSTNWQRNFLIEWPKDSKLRARLVCHSLLLFVSGANLYMTCMRDVTADLVTPNSIFSQPSQGCWAHQIRCKPCASKPATEKAHKVSFADCYPGVQVRCAWGRAIQIWADPTGVSKENRSLECLPWPSNFALALFVILSTDSVWLTIMIFCRKFDSVTRKLYGHYLIGWHALVFLQKRWRFGWAQTWTAHLFRFPAFHLLLSPSFPCVISWIIVSPRTLHDIIFAIKKFMSSFSTKAWLACSFY